MVWLLTIVRFNFAYRQSSIYNDKIKDKTILLEFLSEGDILSFFLFFKKKKMYFHKRIKQKRLN